MRSLLIPACVAGCLLLTLTPSSADASFESQQSGGQCASDTNYVYAPDEQYCNTLDPEIDESSQGNDTAYSHGGCKDPVAANYDVTADYDDASCTYLPPLNPIGGCTDYSATNYSWYADYNDGSCIYPIWGCTDPAAENYDSAATYNNSSCSYRQAESFSGNSTSSSYDIPPSTDGSTSSTYGSGFSSSSSYFVSYSGNEQNDKPQPPKFFPPEGEDTDGDGIGTGFDLWPDDPNRPVRNGASDADGDGLPLGGEIRYGTDPNSGDTDSDGLSDPAEITQGTIPQDPDSDNDGINDDVDPAPTNSDLPWANGATDADVDGAPLGIERELGTNPAVWDTDGDGSCDGEELIFHESDPLNPDTDGDGLLDGEDPWPLEPDGDHDGVSDLDEVRLWFTNPRHVDSDGDSVTDFDEIYRNDTDPNRPDTDGDGYPDSQPNGIALAPEDSDGDGLSDWLEEIYSTDPEAADSDGDGLSDGDEVYRHSTMPMNPDSDGDERTDGAEVAAGTDPNPNGNTNPQPEPGLQGGSNFPPRDPIIPEDGTDEFPLPPI